MSSARKRQHAKGNARSPAKAAAAPRARTSGPTRVTPTPFPVHALARVLTVAAIPLLAFFVWRNGWLELLRPPPLPAPMASSAPSSGALPIVEDRPRRDAIVTAFKHAWHAYERDAWGFDEYHPIGHGGTNLASRGVGYTIVDTLDTLLIMGLTDEYARARAWVADELSFDVGGRQHAFEITIRVLGGLLAAYDLSGHDELYLRKAVELGDRLLCVFDTPSGIAASFVDLAKRKLIYDRDNNNWSSVAEVGTLQLEFRYLSFVTRDPKYRRAVDRAMKVLLRNHKLDGLAPIFVDARTGQSVLSDIRLGSRGDSYYEYLLKQHLQTNQTEPHLRRAYDEAMDGVHKHLVQRTERHRQLFIAEIVPRPDHARQRMSWHPVPKQDHLVCFLAGLLMHGASGPAARDWQTGVALLDTCIDTYASSKTGLGAEIVFFPIPGQAPIDHRDWRIDKRTPANPHPLDGRYILRPETVESIFFAYRLTGEQRYRDQAWAIFQAIERHCRLPGGGYASVRDVDELPVVHEDRQETFWLSETLKYLYLIMSADDVVPIDRHVFTTEAHVLPVLSSVDALPS